MGYVLAMATLTFLILWVYPWEFMPLTVDSSFYPITTLSPWVIDIALLLLFALQHSLMARPFIKEKLFAKHSEAFKAATYTITSSLALLLLYLFWQPIMIEVWSLQGVGSAIMIVLYIVAWVFAFVATFLIDHFALFGLHQGYRALKNIPEPKAHFQAKGFYRFVRHPIQAGTMIGLWTTPVMTLGHLLLSAGFTLYIFIGLYLEEKSLVATFGEIYQKYQKDVPMLLPFFKLS